MRIWGFRVVLTGLLAGLAFACAGGANTAAAGLNAAVPRGQLAIMPLPREAIRAQVTGLPLAHDSGVLSNKAAADNANGTVTASHLAASGRIAGYMLDYGGDAPSGGHVSEIETMVDLYSSDAAAARGLDFWKKDATNVSSAAVGSGVKLTYRSFAAPGFAGSSFADTGVLTIHGVPPLYSGDFGFQAGTLVGRLGVSGDSLARVHSLLVEDAGALQARMQNVLDGRTTGSPVTLPGKQKPGPPPGGPSLKAFALTPADFGSAKVLKQGYQLDDDLEPLSEYGRFMAPAGAFASAQDAVALYRTPLQARYECALLGSLLTTKKGVAVSGILSGDAFTLQHLSFSIGDQAAAAIVLDRSPSGTNVNFVFMVFRFGRVLDFVVLGNRGTVPISRSAVAALAKSIATRARD